MDSKNSVIKGFNCTLTMTKKTYDPQHVVSNNVIYATNKASDQPVHIWSEPLLVAWIFYGC